jgi:pimeloyl-ACP methyl ester carboxylesterase
MQPLSHHRAGCGPALVLIHGIGSRWQVWRPVLERLEREREVVALDLPGFGDSPKPPPGSPAGVESLTALVAEFLDTLGLERPHVAGNSLGGWLALELAAAGRAASATALSPAGFWSGIEAALVRASLWSSVRVARGLAPVASAVLRPAPLRRLLLWQLVGRPERIPPAEAAANVRALAAAPWFDETLEAITGERYRSRGRLPVPATIAWGERDRLLHPRQALRAAQELPGARMLTLRGCGHVPTYDDPAQVARVLLEGSGGLPVAASAITTERPST